MAPLQPDGSCAYFLELREGDLLELRMEDQPRDGEGASPASRAPLSLRGEISTEAMAAIIERVRVKATGESTAEPTPSFARLLYPTALVLDGRQAGDGAGPVHVLVHSVGTADEERLGVLVHLRRCGEHWVRLAHDAPVGAWQVIVSCVDDHLGAAILCWPGDPAGIAARWYFETAAEGDLRRALIPPVSLTGDPPGDEAR
jgi:hypothetical protein